MAVRGGTYRFERINVYNQVSFFIFMVSLMGILFDGIDKFWSNLRRFSYRNRSAMEVAFIFLYAFEQILLIGFTFTASSLEELGFIVSLFAIIVLTTFALHKLVMESRIKLLEQEVNELQHEKFALESSFSQAKKGYSSVFEETISKSLNTHHPFSNKTRPKNENR